MSNFHPIRVPSIRPEKVFLYGDSPHLSLYRGLLERADIKIMGTIGFSVFEDVRSIDIDAARRQANIPVVITTGSLHLPPAAPTPNDPDNSFAYKTALLELTNDGFAGRLLHPSFVADFLDFQLHNCAFVSGFPGSGNILAQRVIFAILEKHPAAISREEIFLSTICQNLDYQILSSLLETINGLDRRRFEMMTYGIGFATYAAQLPDGWLHINDVRCRRQYYQKLYGTHEISSPANVADLKRLGYPLFVCSRHPFDALISLQKKASEGKGETRALSIPLMLQDFAEYANFMSRAVNSAVDIHLIRYEDFLTDPTETIVGIAAHMAIELDESEAETIWESFGMKPLPGAPPGHFRAPRMFGWRDTLDDEATSQLMASEYFAYFTHLGYSDGDLTPLDMDALRSALADLPHLECSPRMGVNVFDSMWMTSTQLSDAQVQGARDALDTEFFRALCRSADYGLPATVKLVEPHRPATAPGIVPEPTGQNWLLLTNSQYAGSEFIGAILAESPQTVYRHNTVALDLAGSVIGASVEAVDYLPQHQGIDDGPTGFSIADHFLHLEHNVEARSYVHSDTCTLRYFLNNLIRFPEQTDILRSRSFRVRNLVTDPLRLIPTVQRELIHFRDNLGRNPTRDAYPYDEAVYQLIDRSGIAEFSDEDVFIRVVLFLAKLLGRDVRLANMYGIENLPVEHILSDPQTGRPQALVANLFDNGLQLTPETLANIHGYRSRHLARATGPVKDVSPPVDTFASGQEVYERLETWQQDLIDNIYAMYGIFALFEPLGYSFHYLNTPTADLESQALEANPFGNLAGALPLNEELAERVKQALSG